MKLPQTDSEKVWRALRKIFPAVGLAFLWILAVWKTQGIQFETNDDKYIAEILSGVITGKPDGHTVYLNYLLAAPLSCLYRMTSGIPWYGGMLVVLHLAMYSALLLSVWSRSENGLERVIVTGMTGCFALINLSVTVNIQFTSTAALLAAAGYICLILHRNPRKGMVLFFLLELLAYLVRDQAMLMMQPLGAGAWIGLCLTRKNTDRKEKAKQAGSMLAVIAAALLIGTIGSLYGYRGEEWKQYNRFNNALVTLFDYCGKPDYEEVRSILEKHDVTRAEYVAFCNNVMADWDISVECVEELAVYARQKAPREVDVGALLKQIWGAGKNSIPDIRQIVVVIWGGALLWMLLRRHFLLALPLGGIALGKTLVWGYLIYGGRMPARVTQPLLSGELFMLTALLIWDYTVGEKTKPGKKAAVLLCGVYGFLCVWSGWTQYRDNRGIRAWQEIYMEGLLEIQQYCNEHPGDRYLLDAWSFSYYTGSAFETRIYRKNNCVYSGGWFTNTPIRHRYLQEYFEGYENDFHLIVYDDGNREAHWAVEYLAEKAGTAPQLEDEITVSAGGIYLVWHFGEEDGAAVRD